MGWYRSCCRFCVGTGHALSLLKTTPYVFVGFHFERWYTQLFLRYLNMNANRFSNNSRNYALKTSWD